MTELTTNQINDFIEDGFIKIENAFSTAIADECRAIKQEPFIYVIRLLCMPHRTITDHRRNLWRNLPFCRGKILIFTGPKNSFARLKRRL